MSVVDLRPDGWPRGRGYAHGTAAEGRVIHVAGQVGWDPVTHELADGFPAQVGRALRNIAAVLETAGGRTDDVVDLTWFLTDRDAYLDATGPVGDAYREVFGRHFPAMTVVVVAALLQPGALVEIRATAVVAEGASGADSPGE